MVGTSNFEVPEMAIDITALLTSSSQTTVLKYLLNLLVGSCHKWLAGSSNSFNQHIYLVAAN